MKPLISSSFATALAIAWAVLSAVLYSLVVTFQYREAALPIRWVFHWVLDDKALERNAEFVPFVPTLSVAGFAIVVLTPLLAITIVRLFQGMATVPLNGWQRLWVLTSGVLLVLLLPLIYTYWPTEEPDVLSDLGSTECEIWRQLPQGFSPDKVPTADEECHSLQSFLHRSKADVRSQQDYRNHMHQERVMLVTLALVAWAFAVGSMYLLGHSISWVALGFARSKQE